MYTQSEIEKKWSLAIHTIAAQNKREEEQHQKKIQDSIEKTRQALKKEVYWRGIEPSGGIIHIPHSELEHIVDEALPTITEDFKKAGWTNFDYRYLHSKDEYEIESHERPGWWDTHSDIIWNYRGRGHYFKIEQDYTRTPATEHNDTKVGH